MESIASKNPPSGNEEIKVKYFGNGNKMSETHYKSGKPV
ncbi:uncharacterized protein METZ01_LOCUS202795, partial [marine metagenome]